MPRRNAEARPADLSKVNANVVMAAVMIGAGLLAVVGTILPGLAGLTGPEATWIPLGFYAFALLDVGVAVYLRWFIRKAHRNSAAGGAVRRR